MDTDLFASSEFHCAEDYISCVPDSQTSSVDAFAATSWPDCSYAFPPAPLISKCLAKMKQLHIMAIMVTPVWKTVTWRDQLQELAKRSVHLGSTKDVCKAGDADGHSGAGRQEQPPPLSAAAA